MKKNLVATKTTYIWSLNLTLHFTLVIVGLPWCLSR